MMYNKSLEDSEKIKDRINNIQEKINNNEKEKKE